MDEGKCVYMAARRGDGELFRSLLLLSSVDDQNERGYSLLHEAAEAGNIGCVREILSMVGEY